jgi:hypothetical protein
VSGERKLPPVTAMGMVALALVALAVIYLSAHLPEAVSVGPALALLGAAALVMLTAFVLLHKVEGFAWQRFYFIAARALLAYIVITGLILYVFLRNETSGAALWTLIAGLALFALDVPLLIGFTVARYAE